MIANRDVYFTYALAVMCAGAGVAVAIRVARGARPHSDRVERIGGTWLLGKGVMTWSYGALDPIVRTFVALGITANAVTWSSLVLGLGAATAVSFGWFGLACLLATFSTVGDILDGQIARATKTGSNRGELLDAAIDRYTEIAFLSGLAIFFRDSAWLLVLTLTALLACVMVSYASAKAEALHVAPPRGLMRRHERSVYMFVGAGLTSLLADPLPQIIGLAAIAVIGNFSAIQRFVRIDRALN